MRQTTCVILVGGLGTRLRSAVPELPKPMAPVAGRPFLEYLVAQVREAGLSDVVLCVGHRAGAIEAHFGDGSRFGVTVRYAHEQGLLGTAGAVRNAEGLIRSDPFVLMNGDSYCEVELGALMAQHRARGAVGTLTVTPVDDVSQYGSVLLGPDDAVTGFTEKGEAGRGWINAGVYALSRGVLERIPASAPCSIERDVFPALAGHGLYAFRTAGLFIDIGVPERFAQAQELLS